MNAEVNNDKKGKTKINKAKTSFYKKNIKFINC